ncbi:flavocytochrome c [uncultured Helicobacter sp.]|uniref:flavocytochrome c n=1 Tax=uncultured Helicobacter sp. TaxID=175537 RepID=UPI0037516B39
MQERRKALKLIAGGVGVCALPLSALAKVFEEEIPKWDREFDAIVVGSGYAGSAAMQSLLDNGIKNVVMIDKMPYLGGNSAYSGGKIAVAGSRFQKEENVEDSKEKFVADILKSGRNINDKELVDIMVEDAPRTLEWLMASGVKFSALTRSGGHSVARSLSPGVGSYITRPLQEKIQKDGGKILTRVIMDGIVYDKKGNVIGLKVREKYQFDFNPDAIESANKSGQVKYYKAWGGVILATGGWGADYRFRSRFDSSLTKEFKTTNHLGATGYTAEILLKDNVKFVDMQYIQSMHVTSFDEGGFGFGYRFITQAYDYGIAINPKTGKRFFNEIADRKIGSDAILKVTAQNEGIPPVVITDIEGAKTIKLPDLQRGMLAGAVRQFETLDELIEYYGINKEPFLEQLARYNGFVDEAAKNPNYTDPEFGRNFSQFKGKYIKVEKPPFFAARPGPKVHHCMGGVKTSTWCEVYDNELKIIKGLYACGELTGGRHGYNRLGSCAVLDCLVYGMRAGEALAKRYNAIRSV